MTVEKGAKRRKKRQVLPPELERAVKLAHRSPTYAVQLLDGRVVQIRREAIAIRADGTSDAKKLARGEGEIRWWARCDGREMHSPSLSAVLHGVACQPVAADDADGHWEQIKLLFSAALALADVVVPCEQQAMVA